MTVNSAASQEIINAYVEAFNAHDMARPRALFAPDAKIYGVLGFGGIDDVAPSGGSCTKV